MSRRPKAHPDVKKTVVQIVGACWVNKGDRLMVRAIQQRLGERYYLPIPVWLNTPAAKLWGPRNMSKMVVQGLRRGAQCLRHGKPRILLDCSGYQYGDPWARMWKPLRIRLSMYRIFVGKGGHVLLMPQSMGPFEDHVMASVAGGVLQLADLAFVRDELSRNHALSVGGTADRVKISPDYSVLADPVPPARPDEWARRVVIVPSVRMQDKTADSVASSYVDGVLHCVVAIRERGLEPCLLVHQEEDRALATALRKTLGDGVPVFDPPPCEAKGILGASHAVVASRYHALVGALSQGTPTVGTGWTHKYRALFEDYGCEDLLLDGLGDHARVERCLDHVCSDDQRVGLVAPLHEQGDRHRERAAAMFDELEATIDRLAG